MKAPGTLPVASQKEGLESSNDLASDLSSESVVSELLLDNDRVSDRLWLPACRDETGIRGRAVFSLCDAGGGGGGRECCCCWTLPRERIRLREARREWAREDLVEDAESRVEVGGGGGVGQATAVEGGWWMMSRGGRWKQQRQRRLRQAHATAAWRGVAWRGRGRGRGGVVVLRGGVGGTEGRGGDGGKEVECNVRAGTAEFIAMPARRGLQSRMMASGPGMG